MERPRTFLDWLQEDRAAATHGILRVCRTGKPSPHADMTAMALLSAPPNVPTFVVDADLWREVCETDVPELEDLPRLPYPVMMLILPSSKSAEVAAMIDVDTGRPFDTPNILLAELPNTTLFPTLGPEDTGWVMAPSGVVDLGPSGMLEIGACRWIPTKGSLTREIYAKKVPEWIVSVSGAAPEDLPLRDTIIHNPTAVGVVNLIALLVDKILHTRTYVSAASGHRRLRPHQTRRAATYLSLTAPSPLRRRDNARARPGESTITPHIRRGHWRRQWVLDAGEREVLEQRERAGKTLLAVRQWIRPCIVGKGEVANREYKVTL